MIHYPAFGICGYSGSGKTTLIVELIKRLSLQGLTVGVIKHDVHGLNIDHEGKDSDRFFKAGADVLMRSPDQIFLRARPRRAIDGGRAAATAGGAFLRPRGEIDLETALNRFCPHYDLVLLEGHKSTPLVDKVWLLKDDQETCPPEVVNVRRVLRRDEDREGIVMEMLRTWLTEKWLSTPVYAGLLIGGKSLRMGQPKHLITMPNGRTWVELIVESVQPLVKQVAILGKGEIPKSLEHRPVLPDVENAQGPLAGILSAMRWRPDVSWLFLSCDMPRLTTDALRWLLANRKPGVWAILPACNPSADGRSIAGRPRRTEDKYVEPLPGWYDFRSQRLLEKCRGPAGIAGHAKVATPLIPAEFAAAWTNVNTVSELDATISFLDNESDGEYDPRTRNR